MIVKIIGVNEGAYRERTFEDVEDYIFTNKQEELHRLVFTGEQDTPYSAVRLVFANKEKDSVSISFNDKCFVMDKNGKTIDVLKYDRNKERYGRGV